MRIGVVFPQTEIGGDVGAVRAYAQRVEELGFRHVLAYDHVVGADPEVHRGWQGPYDVSTTFHEPMVLFGYLAAITSLELVTGIIILPQRQTVLVAKQAAEVDLLAYPAAAIGEVLAERLVLDRVPAQAYAEPELAASEQVNLRCLLGDQRGLPLRQDDDAGHKLQRGNCSQVAEHHERLVEGRVDVVRPVPAVMHSRVGTEDVIVGEDVGETQLLGPLTVRPHRAGVAANFCLRENKAYLHDERPTPPQHADT
jgi:hypothetical protein